MDRAAVFAIGLAAIQQLQGTAGYFSAGCVAFILLSVAAFNLAGGLTRPSGGYIFFYAVLVVIIGLCYKAVLWEPAQSNLLAPKTTILVYVSGMIGMLLAALISKKISRRVGLLQNVLPQDRMYRAAVGSLVFSIAAPYLISVLGSAAGRVYSAFNQLNQLAALAIVIGTMYEIRQSGGTRSVNTPVTLAMIWTFGLYGVLGFSKQGLFTPLYCWFLCVCALRYRLSHLQLVAGFAWLLIVFEILVPFSQYGRRFVSSGPPPAERLRIATRLLSDPVTLRKKYKEGEDVTGPAYFNTAQGFWDRLNFISPDDALINVTEGGHVFGYLPVISGFANVVPRFIYTNKIAYSFGNMYAHEIGGISDEDTTTGISFSPTAEAFHMGRWVGLLVVAPLVWTFLFVVLDSLIGDTRATPWGLLCLTLISHAAPETGISGAIYLGTFGAEILIFSALFATWVSPHVAIAVLGHRKPKLSPLALPRPRSDRLAAAAPAGGAD